jgi:tRNA(Arg) A34 adenosine deaminase TadA
MAEGDDAPTIPSAPRSPALAAYWTKRVHELVALSPLAMSDGMKERHRIFALTVMALVAHYWNGNKYGAHGLYPSRSRQRLTGDDERGGLYHGAARAPKKGEEPGYDFDYLGHNIACIAVDGRGEIIDFDFNHNEIMDSSVEHAESRLVRRVFSLTQIYDTWDTGAKASKLSGDDYSNILSDVTIYTSLESCAQCAGIMALGKVKEVVYLQTDPGMYWIGRILYNLTQVDKKLPSPRPIAGAEFGLEHFAELDAAFQAFSASEQPFFVSGARREAATSVTSFLCTDAALEIFERARDELDAYAVKHPGVPEELATTHARDVQEAAASGLGVPATPLTNEKVLEQARGFVTYAIRLGNRGTPHKP